MRLIDADALTEMEIERCDTTDAVEIKAKVVGRNHMRKIINDAPTIDAVPIVRCGECKYFKDGMCYNPNTYDDEKTCGNTTADWFCGDGERKDGNG